MEFLSLFAGFFFYFLANMIFAETTAPRSQDFLQVILIMLVLALVGAAVYALYRLYREEQFMLPLRLRLLSAYANGSSSIGVLAEWTAEHGPIAHLADVAGVSRRKKALRSRYVPREEGDVGAEELKQLDTGRDMRSGVAKMMDGIGKAQRGANLEGEEDAYVQDRIVLCLDDPRHPSLPQNSPAANNTNTRNRASTIASPRAAAASPRSPRSPGSPVWGFDEDGFGGDSDEDDFSWEDGAPVRRGERERPAPETPMTEQQLTALSRSPSGTGTDRDGLPKHLQINF
jgi:hypothetical protein